MTRPWTVLVIEDDPVDAELLRTAFEDVVPTARLTVAERGGSGLEAARGLSPHLIILDLVLPDVPGLAVLAGLRQDDRTKRIPVLVLTRYQDDGNVWRAYQEHANAFVVKPHDYDGLLQLVEAVGVFWFRFALFASAEEGLPSRGL